MGHKKEMNNIEVIAALAALLEKGDAAGIAKLFSEEAVLTYHGDAAKVGPAKIIPFSGTYEGVNGVLEFLSIVNEFATVSAVGNSHCVYAGCKGLYTLVDVTTTPKCETVVGETMTLPHVLKAEFTKCGCIKKLDIFTDTSAFALFYNENCPPL